MPVRPPIGTVSFSPGLYPNPVLLISKDIMLDPCPTTTSIFAPLPTPLETELYVSAIPLYDRGSSNITYGTFEVV